LSNQARLRSFGAVLGESLIGGILTQKLGMAR